MLPCEEVFRTGFGFDCRRKCFHDDSVNGMRGDENLFPSFNFERDKSQLTLLCNCYKFYILSAFRLALVGSHIYIVHCSALGLHDQVIMGSRGTEISIPDDLLLHI